MSKRREGKGSEVKGSARTEILKCKSVRFFLSATRRRFVERPFVSALLNIRSSANVGMRREIAAVGLGVTNYSIRGRGIGYRLKNAQVLGGIHY